MEIERAPTHPGEILLDILSDTGMSVKDFAKHLGFARETISRVLHFKQPMTANLAHRLEDAGISSARLWLSLQLDYDLWEYKKNHKPKIKPLQFIHAQA